MLLTLTTNFQPDHDAEGAEVLACIAEVLACGADGKAIMRVKIDFAEFHALGYELLDEAGLMHQSIARVLLAASDLIDSFFTDAEPVWEVEV